MPNPPRNTPADSAPRVILVGHCGPDSFLLRGAVSRALPGAIIQSADDQATLAHLMGPDALLLINRVLESGFDTESGIDLIRSIAQSRSGVRMMLISNYPDAQRQAEQAGAYPGFGKRDVYSDETFGRLRQAATGEPIRAT